MLENHYSFPFMFESIIDIFHVFANIVIVITGDKTLWGAAILWTFFVVFCFAFELSPIL